LSLFPENSSRSQASKKLRAIASRSFSPSPSNWLTACSSRSPISPSAGFAGEAFTYEDFQQRLIANTFAISNLAGLCNVGFGQAESNLYASLLVQLCNQSGAACLGFPGSSFSGPRLDISASRRTSPPICLFALTSESWHECYFIAHRFTFPRLSCSNSRAAALRQDRRL